MNIPSKKEIDIQTNHAIYVQFSQSWLLKEHRRSNNFNKDHPETVHLLSKWQKIPTLPEDSTCFNGHEIDINKVDFFIMVMASVWLVQRKIWEKTWMIKIRESHRKPDGIVLSDW